MKQSRDEKLLRLYPVLMNVPRDKRDALVKKAVCHPLNILIILVGGLFFLPPALNALLYMLGLIENIDGDPFVLFLLGAVPYTGLFILLRKVLIPRLLKKSTIKAGYRVAEKEPL